MTRFRLVFNWDAEKPGEAFRPQVAAGRWPFPRPLVMGPFGAWFFIQFHGATDVATPNGPARVEPESLMIFPPRVRFTLKSPLRYVKHSQLRAVGEAIPRWLEEEGLMPWTPIPMGDPDASHRWIREIGDEWKRPNRDPVLAGFLFRCWLRDIRRHRGPVPLTPSGMLQDAYGRMATRFNEPLTMEGLARGLGYSRRHFTHRFRLTYGVSPKKFLEERRMDHARHLLATTAMGIREIGVACGYESPFHFSKAFHAAIGQSPSRWREGKRR